MWTTINQSIEPIFGIPDSDPIQLWFAPLTSGSRLFHEHSQCGDFVHVYLSCQHCNALIRVRWIVLPEYSTASVSAKSLQWKRDSGARGSQNDAEKLHEPWLVQSMVRFCSDGAELSVTYMFTVEYRITNFAQTASVYVVFIYIQEISDSDQTVLPVIWRANDSWECYRRYHQTGQEGRDRCNIPHNWCRVSSDPHPPERWIDRAVPSRKFWSSSYYSNYCHCTVLPNVLLEGVWHLIFNTFAIL